MTDSPDPSTGTLAEEALRLVEALGAIAGAHASGHAHAGSGTAGSGTAGSGTAGSGPESWGVVGESAECRVCPVCRLIAGVRQLRPEVLAHLVAAGEELLAAAREFAAPGASGAAGARPGAGSASEAPTAPPGSGAAPSRLPERIELD